MNKLQKEISEMLATVIMITITKMLFILCTLMLYFYKASHIVMLTSNWQVGITAQVAKIKYLL